MNIALLALLPLLAAPPATPKRPVTDTYHGQAVRDDYRWLERGAAPEVKAWSRAQNAYARAHLDALPGRALIQTRVRELLSARTVSYGSLSHRGGRLFAIKRQPPRQQPFLVVLPSADAPKAERVLVDPNEIDPTGHTHIDWYVPSPDGALVAVSMSVAGTESGGVRLYDVAKGRPTGERVPRVNGGTAGGDLAWAPDGSGFFYTRYPRGAERPEADMDFYQQLYWHPLGGDTAADRYELGKDLPRIAEIQLAMDQRSGRLLATVQKGDGGQFAHYLREKDGTWRQFSRFGDKTLQASFGQADDLYVLSRAGAPRGRLVRVPIADLDVAHGPTVVPQGEDTIVEDFWGTPTVLTTPHRLLVRYQLGGPSTVRAFSLDGTPARSPALPAVSSVSGMTPLGGDVVLLNQTSYLAPPAWYRYDAVAGTLKRTGLFTVSPVDLSDAEVVREFAKSADGTRVPMNIIRPKGAGPGPHRIVVYGYGGYGVNLEPGFSSRARVFTEQGVWYVVTNLRGGGEYGEAWHTQGNLTHKQNVFDDFYACIQHLIAQGYTRPDRLGILGGSNGGLLMGATLTQHPEALRVVVSHVGIYDMLRVELSPNGAFNVPEFGTVKRADHFKAMLAYSPYHNVREGGRYPPSLFLTGENDPRVDPMQSRKMVARLQAAEGPDGITLLRTSEDAGHGGGTGLEERIAQSVDVYAFFFKELGVTYRAPKP